MLKGKNVLLCVTGSIAAYKIAELASRLVKKHCNVDVIMTKMQLISLIRLHLKHLQVINV